MTGVTIHVKFNLPTHVRDMQQPIEKTIFVIDLLAKPLIAEILKRRLLVAKKVPYNSQMTMHENCRPFILQMDDLCFGPPNGHLL